MTAFVKRAQYLFLLVWLVVGTASSLAGQYAEFIWPSDLKPNETVEYRERIFDIDMRINTDIPITNKRQVQVINNGVILKDLMNYRVTKDSLDPSRYHLTGSFILTNQGLNKVSIRLKADGYSPLFSEPLFLNFLPYNSNLHVLSIGAESNLNYSVKDAEDFADIFDSYRSRLLQRELYDNTFVTRVLGKEATKKRIIDEIGNLRTQYDSQRIRTNDVILIYISSHGALGENKQLLIQPADYDSEFPDDTSVDFDNDIVRILKTIPCKKILIIDACQSAGSRSNSADVNQAIQNAVEIEARKKELMVMVSSRGDEYSYEDVRWRNGVFTEALIDGLLNGKADSQEFYGNEDKIVTAKELYQYVRQVVPQMVSQYLELNPGVTQRPLLLNEDKIVGDIALYVVTY